MKTALKTDRAKFKVKAGIAAFGVRRFSFLALALPLACFTARAASIVGTVRAQGKPGTEADASGGKYDSRQFKFVERVDYSAMHEFVVYIEGTLGTNAPSSPKIAEVATRRIAQKGAVFSPHVLPVLVGTTIEWPNYDDILHNVFSFSETKPFDLGLYKSPEVKRVEFNRPGRVDVFCSIHARMSCIILVLEHPFFASASEKGTYKIPEVPPGKYKLTAWHERLPRQTKDINVTE